MTFQPARAGHQNQHLIPKQIETNPVIKALKEGADGNGNPLFDIDDNVRNRLELPTKQTTADSDVKNERAGNGNTRITSRSVAGA